jgi:hypothetical protein
MSLMLVADESLSTKIRNRVSEGAPVWELSPAEMPAWLASAVGGAAVESVFMSANAAVAVLAGGVRRVARAPRV